MKERTMLLKWTQGCWQPNPGFGSIVPPNRQDVGQLTKVSAASKLLEPELPVSSTDDVYDRSDRLAQNAPHITPVGNYLVNGSIVTLFTASGATHNGTDLGSDEHSAGSGNTPATVSISIRKRPTDDIAAVMPSTVFTGSTEAKDPMQPSKELSHPLRRLIEEKEAERQRLARDLHDGVN